MFVSESDDLTTLACYILQFGKVPPSNESKGEQTKSLATELGHLVIVRKGKIDIITDGEQSEQKMFKAMYVIQPYSLQ